MLPDLASPVEILLRIAIFVPLTLLWLAVFVDLYQRDDLPVIRKALWGALAIFAAHIGVLLYFIFRPVPEPPGKDLAISADRSSRIVTRLEDLREAHGAGTISNDEYLSTKRELLGVS
ncbi:MAG: PLDc N-terminal domain-containing protein [Actinomycetia bacterium]|nr:PLDc N-terminal domain-containing protein [Actinomycetes bacterium]